MRYLWIAAFSSLLTVQAHASIEQQLVQCAAIADDMSRLQCYDQLGKGVSQHVATVKTSKDDVTQSYHASTAVEHSQQNAQTQVDKFGIREKAPEPELNDIKSTTTAVTKNPHGSLVIDLSNGQRWQQIGSAFFRLKQGQNVVVKRAALGSFLLSVDGLNSSIRVKRLQ